MDRPTRVTARLIQMALTPLSNMVPQQKRPAALVNMEMLQVPSRERGEGVDGRAVGKWLGGWATLT